MPNVRQLFPALIDVRVPEELREVLLSYLSYDGKTGVLVWREKPLRVDGKPNNRVRVGSEAGWVDPSSGYRKLGFLGRDWYVHRLVWLMATGDFPDEVDHKNGAVADNRLVNLRPATHGENMRNQKLSARNTSGHVGVSWCRRSGLWYAYLRVGGRSISLGRYHAIADAVAARLHGEIAHHGTFSRKLSRGPEA